jgi:hypothetical protein
MKNETKHFRTTFVTPINKNRGGRGKVKEEKNRKKGGGKKVEKKRKTKKE